MFNLVKARRDKGLKDRVVKNKEAVLSVLSENIKGARQCPLMMGSKCLGQFCECFMEFKNIDTETGKEKSFWRCTFVQTPLLLIELNRNIRELKGVLNDKTNNKNT